MNPGDARARGVQDAKHVRLWNDLGSVVLPLKITDAVAQGVVASEKGAWLATSRTGQTISALVSAEDSADLAEGVCYNDTGVEVELVD
jgi:anaerobic dimethyl sulfoxide reductase subunit A